MTKTLIIIGAGGHGKVAADCAENMNVYTEIIFLDDRVDTLKKVGAWRVIDRPENFLKYQNNRVDYFVAIGDNNGRKQWLEKLIVGKVNIATLIHPSAVVSCYVKIQLGTLVCANAVINPFSKIGLGCIVNTSASIDHDCMLNDFVHIAPGCMFAGMVSVGTLSFIGIGCRVIQGISIGINSIIGAGAVVINDLTDNIVAVGVPAKKIKDNVLLELQ